MQKWRGNNVDEVMDFLGDYGEYDKRSKRLFIKSRDLIRPPFMTKDFVLPVKYIVKYCKGEFGIYTEDEFVKNFDILVKRKDEMTGKDYYEVLKPII